MLIQRKILVAFLALSALLGSAAGAAARGLSSPEASLLQTMNAVRTSRGLPSLRLDVRLLRAARGPVYGEDLAWGTSVTAQWVVDKWLASPRHRAVMLRPGFRRIGIGIAYGTFAGHGGAAVVTADFAGR